MKITNHTLIRLINTLSSFGSKKLPQRISFAITRNLMTLSKEYQVYEAQLHKLFTDYGDHIRRDENGGILFGQNGLPIADESVSDELNGQIAELLNISFDADMYLIQPDVFDYDDKDGRYDALSANEMMELQSILCRKL